MQLDHILRRLDFSALSETERKRYINRMIRIVSVIEAQFPHVTRPEQIKLHHCQYFRNVWLPAHSASDATKKEYMRALGLIIRAAGRPETWMGALGVKTSTEQGGRPTKIGVKQSKKFYR
tara:strand:+ start:13870 stop:14229 length:360 start_codon:yes stop_codon:yes gene_type:complete